MEKASPTTALFTRYLLGSLSARELEQVEEQFFSDDDLFCELLETEDQLIEDYLDGQLSAEARDRFERYFLTMPARRRKVEITSLLKHSKLQHSPANELQIEPPVKITRWWQEIAAAWRLNQPVIGFSVAAAVLILAAISALLLIRQPQRTLDSTTAHLASPSPAASATAARVVSLLLPPGSFRSGNQNPTNKALVGAGTESIELTLQAGAGKFSAYQASVQDKLDPQKDLLTTDFLKAEAGENGRQIVRWTIPVSSLPVGDYQVTLRGKSANNTSAASETYDFMVRHQ